MESKNIREVKAEYLESLQVQDQEIKDSFNLIQCDDAWQCCMICQCIIFDPQECSVCEQQFCKICITQWGQQTCPHCRQRLLLKVPNDKFLEDLNRTMMRGYTIPECHKNKIQMSYQDLVKHLKSGCLQMSVKCTYQNCTAEFTKGTWEQHFLHCAFDTYICDVCQCEDYKYESRSHDCRQILMKELQEIYSAFEAYKLKQENEQEEIRRKCQSEFEKHIKDIVTQLKLQQDRNSKLEIQVKTLQQQQQLIMCNSNVRTEIKYSIEEYSCFDGEINQVQQKYQQHQELVLKDETIEELNRQVQELQQRVKDLTCKLDKRQDPVFSKTFGFSHNGQLFQINGCIYCKNHNKELVQFSNKDRDHRCDYCLSFYFKNQEETLGNQCITCKLNICQNCINDPSFFLPQ